MGALVLEDLEDLLTGVKRMVWVGEVPTEVSLKLNLLHQHVYMNKLGLLHIHNRHPDVLPYEVLKIPMDLKNGLWLQEADAPNVIIVSRFDEIQQKRYMTVMKTFKSGAEMWVSSYYRAHARQTASLLKRCRILRSHV